MYLSLHDQTDKGYLEGQSSRVQTQVGAAVQGRRDVSMQ